MSCEQKSRAWSAAGLMAIAALAVSFAYAQHAWADEDQEEGRIVNLSPGGDEGAAALSVQEEEEAPAYWLGIQGQPLDSAVLRTHLQLADDVGVVVEAVVPDSPAAKAGLKRHDVLISVGGTQITDMGVLQQAVAASEGKPVELTLIRLAKEETLSVTPEERPADLQVNVPQRGVPGGMPMGDLQNMLEQLQRGGGMRVFGNGLVLGGQNFDLNQMPGGIEVNITREGDGPAKVTVRRGDESWTVEEGDEQALDKLPKEIRPFVERMLSGQSGVMQGLPGGLGIGRRGGPGHVFDFNFDEQMSAHINAAREQAEAAHRAAEEASVRARDEVRDQLLERMEQLEKQLQQLQEQLQEQNSEG